MKLVHKNKSWYNKSESICAAKQGTRACNPLYIFYFVGLLMPSYPVYIDASLFLPFLAPYMHPYKHSC